MVPKIKDSLYKVLGFYSKGIRINEGLIRIGFCLNKIKKLLKIIDETFQNFLKEIFNKDWKEHLEYQRDQSDFAGYGIDFLMETFNKYKDPRYIFYDYCPRDSLPRFADLEEKVPKGLTRYSEACQLCGK